MDSHSIFLEFVTTSLQSEMSWGTNQKVVFWIFDKRLGEDVQLDSDSQFVDVLDNVQTREKIHAPCFCV